MQWIGKSDMRKSTIREQACVSTLYGRAPRTAAIALAAFLVACAGLLSACGGSSGTAASGTATTGGPTPVPSVQNATVTLASGTGALPYVVTVQTGATITWKNADSVAHTLTTTPAHDSYLNLASVQVALAPGASSSFTFTKAGLYDLYDPAFAQWDLSDQRVGAKPGARGFPETLEEIVWVHGPISGVPTSDKVQIPSGHDEFGDQFLAIQSGGTLTWFNADTDVHVINTVPGWTNGVNPTQLTVGGVKGTQDAPPNGGSSSETFAQPGLYYYYCSAHADIDQAAHRAVAHKDASEYPIPMEGFLLVL
jgi:plastocyanin